VAGRGLHQARHKITTKYGSYTFSQNSVIYGACRLEAQDVRVHSNSNGDTNLKI